ncbi:hypothetical protein J6590_050911 [Homalodisca vitripennis]|nr:hypothetical protein J6590_050911 [Homalodisca vitripennis]
MDQIQVWKNSVKKTSEEKHQGNTEEPKKVEETSEKSETVTKEKCTTEEMEVDKTEQLSEQSEHTLPERSTSVASAAVQKDKPTCSLFLKKGPSLKGPSVLARGKKGTASPNTLRGRMGMDHQWEVEKGVNLITKDLVAVTVKVASQQGIKEVTIDSAYFPNLVLDITLSAGLKNINIVRRHDVSQKASLSDHCPIRFDIEAIGEINVTHRVLTSTNCRGYRVSLAEELEEIEPYQKNELDLERSAQLVEQAITKAYGKNCPLRQSRLKKDVPWCTGRLETLKNKARK